MPFREHPNFILSRVPENVWAELSPRLSLISLVERQVLAETHKPIHQVYFPHGGVVSCVVELAGGGAIEAGMIGRDGVFGATYALDARLSLSLATIQIAGPASVIDSRRLCAIADQFPTFRKLLLSYDQFFVAQVQQTAACNAVHTIHQRLCKWLLRLNQLVGAEFPITHEFLAQMLGVRRTSITEIAHQMRQDGLIDYSRGHMRLIDLAKIRSLSCECSADVDAHFERIFEGS